MSENNGVSVSAVDVESFKGTTFFNVTPHKIGNRAKVQNLEAHRAYLALLAAEIEGEKARKEGGRVDLSGVAADVPSNGKADLSKVAAKASKQLLVSEALENLNSFLQDTKDSLIGRRAGIAQQSRVMKGLYVIQNKIPMPYSAKRNPDGTVTYRGVTLAPEADGTLDLVRMAESIIQQARARIASEFLPAFKGDYEAAKERTRTLPLLEGGLGPIYDPEDYPATAEQFASNVYESSGMTRLYVELGISKNIPPELRAQCLEEYRQKVSTAADTVINGLYAQFQGLLDHAIERLTPGEDGKRKKYNDSLIGNIRDFCEVFDARNFSNDQRLAEMVQKARTVIESVDPEKTRKYANIAETTVQKFTAIKAELDKAITERPGRVFDLDED